MAQYKYQNGKRITKMDQSVVNNNTDVVVNPICGSIIELNKQQVPSHSKVNEDKQVRNKELGGDIYPANIIPRIA